MIFLLDADMLIHAYKYDFPPLSDPGKFWTWLGDCGPNSLVIAEKVLEEIEHGTDGLHKFLVGIEGIRIEKTSSALPYLPEVLTAYGDLDEIALEKLNKKADPYIIAHALELGGTIVTNETPRPGTTVPIKKKIPDICLSMGVSCIRYPRFLWDMGSR